MGLGLGGLDLGLGLDNKMILVRRCLLVPHHFLAWLRPGSRLRLRAGLESEAPGASLGNLSAYGNTFITAH